MKTISSIGWKHRRDQLVETVRQPIITIFAVKNVITLQPVNGVIPVCSIQIRAPVPPWVIKRVVIVIFRSRNIGQDDLLDIESRTQVG